MCKIKGTCKDCDWFNWKVTTDKSYGECINPKNGDEKAMYVSATKLDFEKFGADIHVVREEIKNYAVIMFDEDIMGCVNFEPRDKKNFILSIKNFLSGLWKKR